MRGSSKNRNFGGTYRIHLRVNETFVSFKLAAKIYRYLAYPLCSCEDSRVSLSWRCKRDIPQKLRFLLEPHDAISQKTFVMLRSLFAEVSGLGCARLHYQAGHFSYVPACLWPQFRQPWAMDYTAQRRIEFLNIAHNFHIRIPQINVRSEKVSALKIFEEWCLLGCYAVWLL
jgi:hypothetical protein